jgi:hypothetical protein
MRVSFFIPLLILFSVAAAAAKESYTADSKLTDKLPDRSSKGDGPKASLLRRETLCIIVTLYPKLRCNACGVVSLELEEALAVARHAPLIAVSVSNPNPVSVLFSS